jgi:hypothetical protein
MKENRVVKLFVLEMPRQQALDLLEANKKARLLMWVHGLNFEGALEYEEEAKQAYDKLNFGEVAKLNGEILLMKENAFKAKDTISNLTESMKQASVQGLAFPKTERLVSLASAALERGDYEVARSRSEEATLVFALETKGEFNPIAFVQQNWLAVLASLSALILVGVSLNLWRNYAGISHRLASLRSEEAILLDLMKQIQRECFEQNKLSIEEYNVGMAEYERQLGKVVQEIIDLETRKEHLLKLRGGEEVKFASERKRLVTEIRETQALYLDKGGLETRIYRDRMKSLVQRLTEVEEKLASLEAEKALKGL